MTFAAAGSSALLVDLYELTMGESYLAQGLDERPATFELTCRALPEGWSYLVAAGIGDVLDHLERLRFEPGDIDYLETTGLFTPRFLERLSGLRFHGNVRALPEGSAFFPGEPVLELTAPLLEAQLVETAVLNKIHFPTLIASKAARCVEAAEGRRLVEFGLRRVHGGEAGLKVARSTYMAGFDATSNVQAGAAFGIPVAGTMAHSYIECFADETEAFEAFMSSYPDGSTLLIDTYDTVAGARLAARLGERVGAVRIDSGDLLDLSRRVRGVLDDAGLPRVSIFASGNLDEHAIARLVSSGAPIDGFGVGTRLGTSADAPYLEVAYKLVMFDGRPVQKLSPGKATLPGSKQVWRVEADGRFVHDLIALGDEPGPEGGMPLLELMLRDGLRVGEQSLADSRARAAAERAALPADLRSIARSSTYPVGLSSRLETLDRRLREERRTRA